jgi:hypothetical protein
VLSSDALTREASVKSASISQAWLRMARSKRAPFRLVR